MKKGVKMTDQQKLKGKIEVFIGKAIKIVVYIENEDEITSSLSRLEKIKEQLMKFDKVFSQERAFAPMAPANPQHSLSSEDDPFENIANMLDGITGADLRAKKIFSIKDQSIQLLKPNQFKKVMDAICVVLFVLEAGLGKRDIQYSIFRDIYDTQNIKSGSPLTMIMINMKGAKYIDAKKYKAKVVSLTPKGQEQAINVINKFLKI